MLTTGKSEKKDSPPFKGVAQVTADRPANYRIGLRVGIELGVGVKAAGHTSQEKNI